MSLSITNKHDSGVVLLEPSGPSFKDVLRAFSFPSETVDIPAGARVNLIRVPLVQSNSEGSIISTERARVVIPITEVMGKNMEALLVESFAEGLGGSVNGTKIEYGTQVEDEWLIFLSM